MLEMLLGTCKVKLDTNSMSTSDKTDVKIILKKAEAEQFRLYVMKLMQGQEGDFEEKYSKEDKDHWAIQTNMGDIFTHGLFSVNLLSVLVVIGCVVGAPYCSWLNQLPKRPTACATNRPGAMASASKAIG